MMSLAFSQTVTRFGGGWSASNFGTVDARASATVAPPKPRLVKVTCRPPWPSVSASTRGQACVAGWSAPLPTVSEAPTAA
jgi:hypothetical protein